MVNNNFTAALKFSLIFVAILCFGSRVSLAQGVSFGITGGVNLSSVNMENATYKPGYQVGGFAKLMVVKKFGIQTELLYSNQNTQIQNQKVALNYFSVPILVRYNLNRYINLQVGPQYNMLLESIDPTESISEAIKHKDICLVFGIGVDMPLGFSANLRFLNGLNKVHDATGDITSDAVQLSMYFTLLDFRNH